MTTRLLVIGTTHSLQKLRITLLCNFGSLSVFRAIVVAAEGELLNWPRLFFFFYSSKQFIGKALEMIAFQTKIIQHNYKSHAEKASYSQVGYTAIPPDKSLSSR